MNDRDRLIELIVNADTHDSYECRLCTKKDVSCIRCDAEKFADHLLANGVIVSQCTFKDTIYRIGSKGKIYADWELMYIQAYPDEILYIDDSDNYFTAEDIGKTVFLTKEEAEAELRKRSEYNAKNN